MEATSPGANELSWESCCKMTSKVSLTHISSHVPWTAVNLVLWDTSTRIPKHNPGMAEDLIQGPEWEKSSINFTADEIWGTGQHDALQPQETSPARGPEPSGTRFGNHSEVRCWSSLSGMPGKALGMWNTALDTAAKQHIRSSSSFSSPTSAPM